MRKETVGNFTMRYTFATRRVILYLERQTTKKEFKMKIKEMNEIELKDAIKFMLDANATDPNRSMFNFDDSEYLDKLYELMQERDNRK